MDNKDKMIPLLDNAAGRVLNGTTFGIAVVEVVREPDGNFGLTVSWHGPHLNLLAGATRLEYGLQRGLDQFAPIEKT